jgi:hypothetical protein
MYCEKATVFIYLISAKVRGCDYLTKGGRGIMHLPGREACRRGISFIKNISVFIGVVIFSLLAVCRTATAENDLKSAAIIKLQAAIVKSLPAESSIIRVGVLDFEGDDGTIRNAITSAITDKTSFKVIERADLDKILQEQGLQLKDIMDERTRIEPGKIKGVQGIFFGRVLGMESGFMSYTIRVNLKLDDVEKGEIVLSKVLDVSATSPVRQYLVYGVLAFIVLIVIVVFLNMRRAAVIGTTIKEDVRARRDLVKEISRAVTNISEAKAKLMDKGRTDDAVFLKDAEKDMMLLKQHVENAVRGYAAMHKTKDFKQALELDTKIISSFEDLTKSADSICNTVISGNGGSLEKEVDLLKRDISNMINEFKGRGF